MKTSPSARRVRLRASWRRTKHRSPLSRRCRHAARAFRASRIVIKESHMRSFVALITPLGEMPPGTGGGGGEGPVDPGYSPPWATPGPGPGPQPPLGIWGPNDPRPTPPIAQPPGGWGGGGGGGPVDPGYSPPWARPQPPVDPGYSPPWAQVPGGGGQPQPPLGIWGPGDPRPTLPIAGWNPGTGTWPTPPGGGSGTPPRPGFPVQIPAPIEDPNGGGTWHWAFVPGKGWGYAMVPPPASGTTPPEPTPPPVDPNAPHPDQTLPGDLPPDPAAPA
jgi:hypothetical protein